MNKTRFHWRCRLITMITVFREPGRLQTGLFSKMAVFRFMIDIKFLWIKCRSARKTVRKVSSLISVSPNVFENLRRDIGTIRNESINLLFPLSIDMTLLSLETIFQMHCCCSYNRSKMGKNQIRFLSVQWAIRTFLHVPDRQNHDT